MRHPLDGSLGFVSKDEETRVVGQNKAALPLTAHYWFRSQLSGFHVEAPGSARDRHSSGNVFEVPHLSILIAKNGVKREMAFFLILNADGGGAPLRSAFNFQVICFRMSFASVRCRRPPRPTTCGRDSRKWQISSAQIEINELVRD